MDWMTWFAALGIAVIVLALLYGLWWIFVWFDAVGTAAQEITEYLRKKKEGGRIV